MPSNDVKDAIFCSERWHLLYDRSGRTEEKIVMKGAKGINLSADAV